MFRTCRLAALALPVAFAATLLAAPAKAGPQDVAVVGAGLVTFAPSADTLTLNSAVDAGVSGTFGFQTAVFNVGDSGDLEANIPGSSFENVTIDSQTLAVEVDYIAEISNPENGNLDSLSILGSAAPIYFSAANEYLFIDAYQTAGYGVGGLENFTIQATLTDAPEPASFAVMVVGLALLGVTRRRRSR